MRHPTHALLFAVALAGAVAPARAQEVRGRLLTEDGASPLAGAYVALIQDSAAVATTLTRADGWFQLRAPRPGSYTVRADHLGYRRAELLVRAGIGDPVWVDLRTGPQALELEGLTAEVERRCDVDGEDARRVTRLWDEVSKAFRVAAEAEDRGLFRIRLDQWRRALDPGDLRVVEEIDRREGRGNQRSSPFESLPPDELAKDGYIQEDGRGGYRYYAPDARVLLSRSFQDSHCWGIEEEGPDDGEAEWVGIGFEPRDTEEPDIEGVLWIDEATLEPVRLDFRYTDLPWPVDHDALGGRVGFRRLPEGPWIVSDWRIRMPVIDAEEYRPYASASLRLRYRIARLTEVGGQVVEVGRRGGPTVTFGETGRLEGRVREASGEPAAEALVVLAGTFFRTVTGPDGTFALDGVPGGRYRVVSTSPVFDSLGVEGEGVATAVVRPSGTSTVELTLPDAAALLAEQCPTPLREGAPGVLRGVLAPPPGGAVDDLSRLEVRLSWTEAVDLEMPPGTVGVEVATARAAVPVDADGGWRACGVPVDEALRAQVVGTGPTGRPVSEAREVRARAGEVARVVLPLQSTEAFEAPVELEGLTVEVAGRVRDDLLDMGVRREALGPRFIDTEEVRESLPGAIDAAHLMERQHIPGVGVKMNSDIECVFMRRATQLSKTPVSGIGTKVQLCARLVVDGVPAHPSVLRMIRPEQVAAMAFLSPIEARARFSDADGGVLYIWTHGGVEGARR